MHTYTYDYGICMYILAKMRSCVPADRERVRAGKDESRRQLERGEERGEKEKERERGKQRARARDI
jgi:hypothetical protein